MQDLKCRALTIKTKREARGYYCQVEGKHCIILDDAEYLRGADIDGCIEDVITGFVEVDPETVKELKTYVAETTVLKQDLLEFGVHKEDCKTRFIDTTDDPTGNSFYKDCTCGFEQALGKEDGK